MEMSGGSFWGAMLVALGPLLLGAMALVPRRWANANPRRMASLSTGTSGVVFVAAIIASILLALHGRIEYSLSIWGPFNIGIYFDVLSATILLLVAFIGAIVMRFAVHYLAGDPEQGRFFKWLCATLGAVLTLMVSSNLVMFTIAWIATSLALHKLLTFYSHRPLALVAARKKFIISRLGDMCLIGVIALTYKVFGSWDFSVLFAKAQQMSQAGSGSYSLTAICLLLVAGAMLKSAQFPFHSWLPDTMETPTPVSALMHAGIINAGGFLIIRLSPIVSLSSIAMDVLTIVGAVTALFASLVMLTQASIKRNLAFSTVAQMGFMMLQCGLGAFSIAVLHIVAHSMYKAHAFLSSGSAVANLKTPPAPSVVPMRVLATSLVTAVLLSGGMATLFGVSLSKQPEIMVLVTILTLATTQLLLSLWKTAFNNKTIVFGLSIAVAINFAYFMLHGVFKSLLSPVLPYELTAPTTLRWILLGAVIVGFGAVLILQSQLAGWISRPWLQKLYIQARNGFYFNTLANRAVQALWPAH
jgi:NAD(P)H-quinone oxidoreductase subunit 5